MLVACAMALSCGFRSSSSGSLDRSATGEDEIRCKRAPDATVEPLLIGWHHSLFAEASALQTSNAAKATEEALGTTLTALKSRFPQITRACESDELGKIGISVIDVPREQLSDIESEFNANPSIASVERVQIVPPVAIEVPSRDEIDHINQLVNASINDSSQAETGPPYPHPLSSEHTGVCSFFNREYCLHNWHRTRTHWEHAWHFANRAPKERVTVALLEGEFPFKISEGDERFRYNHRHVDQPTTLRRGRRFYGGSLRCGDLHGTAVIGSVGAAANSVETVGLAPWIDILYLEIYEQLGGKCGPTNLSIARAIRHAADEGAKVINVNVGGSISFAVQQAINYAVIEKGAIFIAPAGNSGPCRVDSVDDVARCREAMRSYPCAADNAICVSALKHTITGPSGDRLWIGSSWGDVDFTMPGSSIYTMYPNRGDYRGWSGFVSGTSIAAPQLAAFAALVWQKHPQWTNTQVLSQLAATSEIPLGERSIPNDPEWQEIEFQSITSAEIVRARVGAGVPNIARALGYDKVGWVTGKVFRQYFEDDFRSASAAEAAGDDPFFSWVKASAEFNHGQWTAPVAADGSYALQLPIPPSDQPSEPAPGEQSSPAETADPESSWTFRFTEHDCKTSRLMRSKWMSTNVNQDEGIDHSSIELLREDIVVSKTPCPVFLPSVSSHERQ